MAVQQQQQHQECARIPAVSDELMRNEERWGVRHSHTCPTNAKLKPQQSNFLTNFRIYEFVEQQRDDVDYGDGLEVLMRVIVVVTSTAHVRTLAQHAMFQGDLRLQCRKHIPVLCVIRRYTYRVMVLPFSHFLGLGLGLGLGYS